jgi:WD40 repeat protein
LARQRGIQHLHGLPGRVVRTVFSRDGKRVAALSWDWWAGVWERNTGRLLWLFAVPRGQFADNADLTCSPDAGRLAVSAGNTATLWDLETGKERRWTLPWALTEALAFPAPDRLLLLRTETRDGSRPPGSGAPPEEYPRLCVLRDLLSPTPKDPMNVINAFGWGVQGIEAAPDGSCFVIVGTTGRTKAAATRSAKVYDPEGRFRTELSTQHPSDTPGSPTWFDPSGKLFVLVTRPRPGGTSHLFEMPAGRYLGPVPVEARGLAPGARLWVGLHPDNLQLRLHDQHWNLLVDKLNEGIPHYRVPFSPDLDGRYLLWGNPSGLVSVADLVELQRRLTEVGLGW